MRWRVVLFAAAMVMSPMAQASTELRGGGAWFWNALGLGESVGDIRNEQVELGLPKPYSTDPGSASDSAADAWAFAVDKALMGGGSPTAPSAAKYDAFNWVFLLIAFAGLTALFAGRRTGGRGLISR